ncbi:MAG: dUTPase [Epsilonproteobacteria bacterium]|nr:MAG: dUTPase [Campylobacterota bacterium]
MISDMLTQQKRLNDETNGANWELGINKFKKEINWPMCIYMETAELIDSLPWKHWKDINKEPDINNIKVELSDIWHFVLSLLLQECSFKTSIKLTQDFCSYDTSSQFDNKKVQKDAEIFMKKALNIATNDKIKQKDLSQLLQSFFELCASCQFSLDDLYMVYIAKNCLNKFRQDHGYKDGTYKKNWDGKEDNEYLSVVLKSNKNISFDELYAKLEKIYDKL